MIKHEIFGLALAFSVHQRCIIIPIFSFARLPVWAVCMSPFASDNPGHGLHPFLHIDHINLNKPNYQIYQFDILILFMIDCANYHLLYRTGGRNMMAKMCRDRIFQVSLIIGLVLGIISGVQAGALDAFNGDKGTVKISGGTAHIPVMKEAAKRMMTFNSGIQISIAGGGSGVGIKQVGEGLVDIGNSGRAPTDEEINKYQLKMFKWAIDGVGVVVNPKNTVKSLSKAQLIDIFSGKISNWKDLGGLDKAINVYTRDKASGTRDVFWKKALDKGDITDKANFVVSNGAMKSAISSNPYGIGYVSVGHIDESVASVALDGVVPTLENVKQGKYKIARGLYSNTKGDPSGLVKKFIEYLFSPEGQEIAAQKGFIPVQQ